MLFSSVKQTIITINLATPVFRYVPKSHRKNGESILANVQFSKAQMRLTLSPRKPVGMPSKKRECLQFIKKNKAN